MRGGDRVPDAERPVLAHLRFGDSPLRTSVSKGRWTLIHTIRRNQRGESLELFDLYGAYPTNIAHTKQYVPFYQGYGVKPNRPEPLIPFDAIARVPLFAAGYGVPAGAVCNNAVSFMDFATLITARHRGAVRSGEVRMRVVVSRR